MANSKIKRKRITWVFMSCGFGLLFWIALYKTLDTLPGQAQWASAIKQNSDVAEPTHVQQSNPLAQGSAVAEVPSPVSSGEPVKVTKKNDSVDAWILTIIDEDVNDIRVCDQLGQTKMDLKKKDNHLEFEDVFKSDRTDSITESIRIPLKAMFQVPEVSSMMREVVNLSTETKDKEPKEKESFLEKIGFYARATQAASSLYSRKGEIEALADRSMHLMALARLAVLKPELKDSSRLSDFCKMIQKADLTLNRDKLKTERADLMKLLEEFKVKPDDIDFDPDQWIKFNLKFDKSQISFSLSDKEKQD